MEPRDGGEKWFCGECGSSVFGLNPSHPDSIGIRGAFDDDPDGIEVDLVGGNHEPRVGQSAAVSWDAAAPRRYDE